MSAPSAQRCAGDARCARLVVVSAPPRAHSMFAAEKLYPDAARKRSVSLLQEAKRISEMIPTLVAKLRRNAIDRDGGA